MKESRIRRRQRRRARKLAKLLAKTMVHYYMCFPVGYLDAIHRAACSKDPRPRLLDLVPLGALRVSKTLRKAYYAYFDAAAGKTAYHRLSDVHLSPDPIHLAPDWAGKE